MKAVAFVFFLVAAIGGLSSLIEAKTRTEAEFHSIALITGVSGLCFLARLRRRQVGARQFEREIGIDWPTVRPAIWWLMAAPTTAYVLITHIWHVDAETQGLLLILLIVIGNLIYFIPRS